jgi:hypothetical protein
MAPRASPPPAALAALPVIADQDTVGIFPEGGIIEGVAQRALGSLPAGGITKELPSMPPAPCHHTRWLKLR